MNTLSSVLQVLLAIHTAIGAVWKFSNTAEQTMPSLRAIPNAMWLGLSGIEILVSICLLMPFVYKPVSQLVPIAAVLIVAEMLLFACLHFRFGDKAIGPVVYWLIVAIVSGVIAYRRFSCVAGEA